MYVLKFYCSYSSGDIFKEIYERLCETQNLDYYGEGKKVHITNGDDYTHIIIINTAMPEIPNNIPKENVIGLAFEPFPYLGLSATFIEYATKYIGKYYIGDKKNLPECFKEHYAYMPHITPLKIIPNKTKTMSLIFSNKSDLNGHKYRHTLVKRILDENLPVDIYGRGCRLYENYNMKSHPQLKGTFNKLEPYENYKYHIAIENIQSNHYFSEKITNTLLCETIPIYLGCKNINSYFPEQVIHLTGDVDKDILMISSILENPENHTKVIDVFKIKQTIGLIQNIDNVFDNS